MEIDAFFTPFFAEEEKEFDNSYIVMIDVLRASTTVCAALYNKAEEVIPCENAEKAGNIYNSLSKTKRFIGGEKRGVKPEGYDAGNSPSEYKEELISKRTVILSTSNGTKIFNKFKQAKMRIIGCFANLNVSLELIKDKLEKENSNAKIVFLCAGSDGRLSYEDALCAGAYIDSIAKNVPEYKITDTALAARDLYNLHRENLHDYLKEREHAKFLKKIGQEDDIDLCLTIDKYPVVPIIEGIHIKNAKNFDI